MVVERALTLIEPTPLRAEVVHGFGRGSKVLGFPTANMDIRWGTEPAQLSSEERAVLDFAADIETGIYAAYACVDDGPDPGVYKVAMSVGWNPTFTDLKSKTIEPWILHDYDEDFYGCHLRVLVVAYIRPEVKFESFEELIQEIRADGDFCSQKLDSPELAALRSHTFLSPRPALPLVDAGAIAAATGPDDPAIQALGAACSEQGFFVLENHGISSELIDRGFQAASDFFGQSEELKLKHVSGPETNYRGYTPLGGSHNCSPASRAPERKETFYFGGQSDWGEAELIPELEGFDHACKEFHTAMIGLSRTMLKGLSLSLGVEADYFETRACQDPAAKVLLTVYPPVEAGEMSCGAHTDCGFLTILCSSGGRGLQVRRLDGSWISVASSRYKFVCNLGELASKLTNGRYKSTPHRVLNDSSMHRQSLIFFNNLDQDAPIQVVPTCATQDQEPELRGSCGEYVASKLQSMRDNYQDGAQADVAEPEWSEVHEAEPLK